MKRNRFKEFFGAKHIANLGTKELHEVAKIEKMKPCKICGAKGRVSGPYPTVEGANTYSAGCTENSDHWLRGWYDSEEEAISAWNNVGPSEKEEEEIKPCPYCGKKRAETDRTDELLKAISELKDLLEKANAISIPTVWVNERPVRTTGTPPIPSCEETHASYRINERGEIILE